MPKSTQAGVRTRKGGRMGPNSAFVVAGGSDVVIDSSRVRSGRSLMFA
jgi:hypothetical protein